MKAKNANSITAAAAMPFNAYSLSSISNLTPFQGANAINGARAMARYAAASIRIFRFVLRYNSVTADRKTPSKRQIRLFIQLRCIIEARTYSTGVTIRFVPHASIPKYSPSDRCTPSTALFVNTIATADITYIKTLFALILKVIAPF